MFQSPSKNSQLIAWLQEQQKPHRLRVVMAKERHQEFLKQAEEQGYLLSPMREFLLEQYTTEDEGKKNLDHIMQVQLSNMRLKDVGELGLCQNLRYCSLPGNYITNFEALKYCTYLVRLDLHANQISTIPGPKFWQGLPDLQVLYLHNNSVGKLSCLQSLGAAPNLQLLTLFDTPISLKSNYRHHVVNSIFSLKALDFHVISDEEIIEDARFGGHFGAMHESFQFDPLLNFRKERSIEEEKETIRQLFLEVGRIQAKHSPVVIIQRHIRGFLGRCRGKRIAASRTWAAVAIQRSWREYKGLEYKPEKPLTEEREDREVAQRDTSPSQEILLVDVDAEARTPSPAPKEDPDLAVRSKLDYDTYMKNRRPGSLSPGVIPKPQESTEVDIGSTPSPTGRHRANIMIDLTKLEGATQLVPIELSHTMTHQSGSSSQLVQTEMSSLVQPQGIEKDTSKLKAGTSRPTEKKRKCATVYEMLGRLESSNLHRETDNISEDPPIKFRIAGSKSVLHRCDPTQELLIERREAGRDIRAIHRDVIDVDPPPKPDVKKKKRPNANQQLFAKMHGTMGMASLRAVQQAYKDREKAETATERSDYILHLREERERGQERRRLHLEDRRLAALHKNHQDIEDVSEALMQQATIRQEEMERSKEVRSKREEIGNSLNQDKLFASDFNGQLTSISTALRKHDRHMIRGGVMQRKEGIVKSEREHQKCQAELVQRYLEHRKLMRHAQVAVERAALDSKLLQETNNRLITGRNRVVHQKHKRKAVQAFYPLPKSATDPVLPAVPQEGKPNQFETLISMYDGRVGNHPTAIGHY